MTTDIALNEPEESTLSDTLEKACEQFRKALKSRHLTEIAGYTIANCRTNVGNYEMITAMEIDPYADCPVSEGFNLEWGIGFEVEWMHGDFNHRVRKATPGEAMEFINHFPEIRAALQEHDEQVQETAKVDVTLD